MNQSLPLSDFLMAVFYLIRLDVPFVSRLFIKVVNLVALKENIYAVFAKQNVLCIVIPSFLRRFLKCLFNRIYSVINALVVHPRDL